MTRIRSIKPEFWTSEQVMKCSPLARLLFIGLWNFCDDAGRRKASAISIKAQLFPGDAVEAAAVRALIDELAKVGLVRLYRVDNAEYLCVTGWAKHQAISKPQPSRLPAPPTLACAQTGDLFSGQAPEPPPPPPDSTGAASPSWPPRRAGPDRPIPHSQSVRNAPGMAPERSMTESSRVEGNGEEKRDRDGPRARGGVRA